MRITDKIDKYLKEAKKPNVECMECGHKFNRSLKAGKEVRCPKCRSVDIETI
jgi:DNA-directed RNA polymerase subunit RPC12/RpoP